MVPDVDQLLDKYFEGETNLREEAALRRYFSENKNVNTPFAAYFQYIHQTQSLASQRPFATPKKHIHQSWWAVAALVALVVGGFWFNQRQYAIEQQQAELHFSQFKEGMQLISNQLNKGKNSVVYLENFDRVTQQFLKNE